MKRRTLDLLFSIGGVGIAALLLIIGVVMSSNADFSKRYVTDQLKEQRITFKAADALTEEERKSQCLVKYAGQALTTGKQAECYANDFIGLHVTKIAGGKTYAQMRGPEQALLAQVTAAQKAGDPAAAELQKQHAAAKGQREALFQGETSRGLLLTSFGFSVLGEKAGQAATTAYLVAGLVALLSLAALVRGRKVPAGAPSSEVAEEPVIPSQVQLSHL